MEPALQIASIDKLTKERPQNEKEDCYTMLYTSFPLFKGCMKIKGKPEEFGNLAK